MEIIRSASNSLIRRVRAVAAGREDGVLLLEGDRLVDEALAVGLPPQSLLVSSERAQRLEALCEAGHSPVPVAPELLARVSTLVSAPGILALVTQPAQRSLAELAEAARGFLVVVAGIADPGNLGALARSAEAAGAGALLVLEGGCSPWNPKALRGSMGSLLRLPIGRASSLEASAAALADLGLRQILAATQGGRDHQSFDWSGAIALWLTGETGELAEQRAAERFERVSIELAGSVESLNVTAAAAVLLFAARRARGGMA